MHIQCSVQCVRLRTVLQCLERMRAVALPLCCRLSSTSALYQASSVQATAPLQSSWVLAIACTALSRAAIMAFQPPFSNAERLFPLHAGPGSHWPGLHSSSLHDAVDCMTRLNARVLVSWKWDDVVSHLVQDSRRRPRMLEQGLSALRIDPARMMN